MAGKVFMACTLGGGVGALVALQMWQPLWWVGMLVGGLIGYLTYEFNEVRRAVSQAWREVSGWRPNREWWRVFLRLLPVISIGPSATIIAPLFFLSTLLNRGWDPILNKTFMVCFALFSIAMTYLDAEYPKEVSENLQLSKKLNVFRVYFWVVPRAVLKSVWLVATRSPGLIARGVVTIARFFRYLFVLVHSEVRLLCGLDAALGAAIGYYAGHAGIGALAGGLIGVANFEVISKRWLKLVPMKAK